MAHFCLDLVFGSAPVIAALGNNGLAERERVKERPARDSIAKPKAVLAKVGIRRRNRQTIVKFQPQVEVDGSIFAASVYRGFQASDQFEP